MSYGTYEFQVVRVYYEDTDFSGVVYHARYLHFCERARTEALRACGVDHTDLLALDEPLAIVIRKMDCTFHAPARIDDLLTVRSEFDPVSGARISARQAVFREEKRLFSAGVEAACVALSGRPRRLPAAIARKLGAGAH